MAIKDTATGATVKMGNFSPPSSYTTGGILIDLSADFSWLGFVNLEIETVGSLMPVHFEWQLNEDLTGAAAPGKAVVKLMRNRYDEATIGNVSGNPGGTTVQASKTAAATTTGSSHLHSMAHNHPNTTSANPVAGGVGVNSAAGQPGMATHTHDVDLPSITVDTGSATHTHDRSFEYDHNHSFTAGTQTNAASTEVAAATNLSTTVFRYFAAGF